MLISELVGTVGPAVGRFLPQSYPQIASLMDVSAELALDGDVVQVRRTVACVIPRIVCHLGSGCRAVVVRSHTMIGERQQSGAAVGIVVPSACEAIERHARETTVDGSDRYANVLPDGFITAALFVPDADTFDEIEMYASRAAFARAGARLAVRSLDVRIAQPGATVSPPDAFGRLYAARTSFDERDTRRDVAEIFGGWVAIRLPMAAWREHEAVAALLAARDVPGFVTLPPSTTFDDIPAVRDVRGPEGLGPHYASGLPPCDSSALGVILCWPNVRALDLPFALRATPTGYVPSEADQGVIVLYRVQGSGSAPRTIRDDPDARELQLNRNGAFVGRGPTTAFYDPRDRSLFLISRRAVFGYRQ